MSMQPCKDYCEPRQTLLRPVVVLGAADDDRQRLPIKIWSSRLSVCWWLCRILANTHSNQFITSPSNGSLGCLNSEQLLSYLGDAMV